MQHSWISNTAASLSFSIHHSFLSPSLHLRNRESLPLGSRGNNEVPVESGSSTTEQRLRREARGGGGGLRDLFHLVLWGRAEGEAGGGHAQSSVACCRRPPGVRVFARVSFIDTHSSISFSSLLSLRVAPTPGIHSVLFPCTDWCNYQKRCLHVSVHVCLPLVKLLRMQTGIQCKKSRLLCVFFFFCSLSVLLPLTPFVCFLSTAA